MRKTEYQRREKGLRVVSEDFLNEDFNGGDIDASLGEVVKN